MRQSTAQGDHRGLLDTCKTQFRVNESLVSGKNSPDVELVPLESNLEVILDALFIVTYETVRRE